MIKSLSAVVAMVSQSSSLFVSFCSLGDWLPGWVPTKRWVSGRFWCASKIDFSRGINSLSRIPMANDPMIVPAGM